MSIVDLPELDTLEIKITHHADGYRVWLNGPQGLLFRAYRVKKIILYSDKPLHHTGH